MGLMAAYYIFNVGYPLKMKRTFLFIQLELLKVQGRDDRKDNVMKSFYKKIIESYQFAFSYVCKMFPYDHTMEGFLEGKSPIDLVVKFSLTFSVVWKMYST